MPIQVTSSSPGDITISGKNQPTISSQTMASAGTEYTVTISLGTRAFRIKPENDKAILKVATSPGGTTAGDNYWTYDPGELWEEDLLKGSSTITYYVNSNKAGTILKIISWN